MAQDITSELNSKDLSEFRKDFTEFIRVYFGISREYSKNSRDADKYIGELNGIIGLFNKKYKNLAVRLKKTPEEFRLRIFIKEKSVRDAFVNVASKLNGLRAIGASDFGRANIDEADKFSKELDKVKNRIFISFFEQEVGAISLEYYNKGMIELHYSGEAGNERSPEFKLCAYYAVKNGIGKINIHERLSAIGFAEMPGFEKVRDFLKKFNPRIEE